MSEDSAAQEEAVRIPRDQLSFEGAGTAMLALVVVKQGTKRKIAPRFRTHTIDREKVRVDSRTHNF